MTRIIDKSYGVILIHKTNKRFLLLQQIDGHWSFPKGHLEGNEAPKDAALRELKEESGITEIEFVDNTDLYEHYTFTKHEKQYDKTVQYFIAFTDTDVVSIQEEEVIAYKWATYEEAMNTFTFKAVLEVLKQAKEYLDNYEQGK